MAKTPEHFYHPVTYVDQKTRTTRTAVLCTTINWPELARELSRRAGKNKSGKATLVKGAVKGELK